MTKDNFICNGCQACAYLDCKIHPELCQFRSDISNDQKDKIEKKILNEEIANGKRNNN